jgi:excisionase family DNA binding protein
VLKGHESTPGDSGDRRSELIWYNEDRGFPQKFFFRPLSDLLEISPLYMQEQAYDRMSITPSENQAAGTDVLSQLVEAACGAAIRKALNIADIPPRRLVTIKETAIYLAISEREVYKMLANNELLGVRHGRRLMIDIRDLESWIDSHKAA